MALAPNKNQFGAERSIDNRVSGFSPDPKMLQPKDHFSGFLGVSWRKAQPLENKITYQKQQKNTRHNHRFPSQGTPEKNPRARLTFVFNPSAGDNFFQPLFG